MEPHRRQRLVLGEPRGLATACANSFNSSELYKCLSWPGSAAARRMHTLTPKRRCCPLQRNVHAIFYTSMDLRVS